MMQTGTITAAAMMAELTPLEEDDDPPVAGVPAEWLDVAVTVAVAVAVADAVVDEPVAAGAGVSVALAVETMRCESVSRFR